PVKLPAVTFPGHDRAVNKHSTIFADVEKRSHSALFIRVRQAYFIKDLVASPDRNPSIAGAETSGLFRALFRMCKMGAIGRDEIVMRLRQNPDVGLVLAQLFTQRLEASCGSVLNIPNPNFHYCVPYFADA